MLTASNKEQQKTILRQYMHKNTSPDEISLHCEEPFRGIPIPEPIHH